jgi:hypothetical protein
LNDVGKVYVPVTEQIQTDASKLTAKTTLAGPQGKQDNKATSSGIRDGADGNSRQYLVDETGKAIYLVDPGINGSVTKRPDGSEVKKFEAPKRTLVSYIIKGILSQKLPWALVLFGVMIAIVLEMSGIPVAGLCRRRLSARGHSAPVFIGGLVRWLVDGKRRQQPELAHLTEEEHIAEGDKSPGVLMASGYIAGGAIAGIVIAFMAGVFSETNDKLDKWATAHNPFYSQEVIRPMGARRRPAGSGVELSPGVPPATLLPLNPKVWLSTDLLALIPFRSWSFSCISRAAGRSWPAEQPLTQTASRSRIPSTARLRIAGETLSASSRLRIHGASS